jgi:hypothetical protein
MLSPGTRRKRLAEHAPEQFGQARLQRAEGRALTGHVRRRVPVHAPPNTATILTP